MSETTLTASFQADTVEIDGDCLKISQKKFVAGKMTGRHIVGYLLDKYFDYGDGYEYDSGLVEDDQGQYFNTTVLVHPLVADLNYTAYVSHGDLSERTIHKSEYTELVAIDLSGDEPAINSLEYKPDVIISAKWVGRVYDGYGNVIDTEPVITVDGTDISVSKPVYGTMKITYETTVHQYIVRVYKRDAPENLYQCTFYTLSPCGIDYLNLQHMTNAEEYDDFAWGKISGDITEEEDDELKSSGGDASVSWEYCWPHELISAYPSSLYPNKDVIYG